MGVLDKLLDAVKLNDDYDDDDYLDEEDDFLDDIDDEDDDDYLESKPKKNFFSKFAGLGKKSDDYEDDEFEEDEPVKARSKFSRSDKKETEKESGSVFNSRSAESSVKSTEKAETASRSVKASSKITPMRTAKRSGAPSGMEVCVIKPRSMEDTREIADTLLDNSMIILNLEGIDVELAQRITDFSSGACYSLGGRLQRISGYIFVMVPYNVDITGDLQNVLGGTIPSVKAGY